MIYFISNLIRDFVDNYIKSNFNKCPFCSCKILTKRFYYGGLYGLNSFKRINYHCKHNHVSYEYNEDTGKLTRIVYNIGGYFIIKIINTDYMSIHKPVDLLDLNLGTTKIIPDPSSWISVPYIDLEKYTIDKAIGKIKTLILFS